MRFPAPLFSLVPLLIIFYVQNEDVYFEYMQCNGDHGDKGRCTLIEIVTQTLTVSISIRCDCLILRRIIDIHTCIFETVLFIQQGAPVWGVDLAQQHVILSVTIINRNILRKFSFYAHQIYQLGRFALSHLWYTYIVISLYCRSIV